MATTRIIPMHINKGKTIAQCLKARIDYVKNPEKTEQGDYVSSFACDPETADHEFLLARNAYIANTGKHLHGEVIAYQMRQSFKPGEITPEQANKVGYETAMRFLKGRHAFIVATHTDREHIHNHIVWSSTTLQCDRKFKNFYNSYKAVRRLSDQICAEHYLSVIAEPGNETIPYHQTLGNEIRPTNREKLCMMIDEALQRQPQGFDALMKLLEETGIKIKYGKTISLLPPGGQRFIRIDTLGPEYSQSSLRASVKGMHQHKKRKYRGSFSMAEVGLLIDIEKKMQEGKGRGFQRWAQRTNTKLAAKTMVYIKEHKLKNYAQLEQLIHGLASHRDELNADVDAANMRMEELIMLRKTITDYRRTRDIYVQYRESGWSQNYYSEHQQQIDTHMAAKKQYDAVHGQMPTLKEISAEFEKLKEKKKECRDELKAVIAELHEALNVKANVDEVTNSTQVEQNTDEPEKITRT